MKEMVNLIKKNGILIIIACIYLLDNHNDKIYANKRSEELNKERITYQNTIKNTITDDIIVLSKMDDSINYLRCDLKELRVVTDDIMTELKELRYEQRVWNGGIKRYSNE